MAAPVPPDEPRRLEAVRRYTVATQPRDPRFDRITRLAAWTFEVPIAVVSLIDEHGQHLQAGYGIEEPEGLPRELAFCSYTILSDEVLVIEDARQDERFAGHPMVAGPPRVRFYAGAPLLAGDGHRLGTLCLVDAVPRTLSPDERARLKDLAVLVVDEMELCREIEERRQVEQALQQALERERELSEMKSRFVAMASHELRTPLATIQASAELIEGFRTRWEQEKTDEHLQRILNNVQDMTALLEDVLLLGRAGSDRLPFEPRRMPLRPFAASLIDEMQGSLGARHAIVLDAGEEVNAEVDATLLRLVLNNLLTNAVKYSPEGATVRVGLRPEPGEVVLEVADTGIGIPEADHVRLFEPFHRASNVGARRGTGLGLSIVRRAVDMHGGHIHLESREGDGTTVTVRLPLRQPAPDERPAAGAREEERPMTTDG